MILLKAIIQVSVCPMPHTLSELCPDCPGIRVVAVRRDPVRGDAGDSLGRSKEGLGRGEVAVLAQHDINQGAIAIDRTIQILPAGVHPDIGLVDVPASADFALRLRRRSSARAGVSFASQSRTAS